MSEPILCYVHGDRAFFTYKSLSKQWGDDWNDVPYECNAGYPYGDDIVSVFFITPIYCTPDTFHYNSPYSVEMINKGIVPWLADYYSKPEKMAKPIFAGITLSEFKNIIKESGGEIYTKED